MCICEWLFKQYKLLFLAYVNDIWRNTEFNIRLFADDCKIYRKIMDSSDIDESHAELNRLGEWAVENEDKSRQK
jgi:hypothetical protein